MHYGCCDEDDHDKMITMIRGKSIRIDMNQPKKLARIVLTTFQFAKKNSFCLKQMAIMCIFFGRNSQGLDFDRDVEMITTFVST